MTTSRKSSESDREVIIPLAALGLGCQAVKNMIEAARDYDRVLEHMRKEMMHGKETGKRIRLLALRPTRKRRVGAEQFEFKH